MPVQFAFDNSYARLPGQFYTRLEPTPVQAPGAVRINAPLARELGLDPDALATPEGLAVLAGNRLPEGAEPLAQVYAGHQFGGFVPQLGDGRAVLLGEIIDSAGRRRDIQLKGAGLTPYSRMGDGRAWIGPVLREYAVSEAIHALGIPTTRALAAVTTGEPVYREAALPGAILARVAASHVRVGTFQYFAARSDRQALELLTAHVIDRHYPEAAGAAVPALALLEATVAAQARLVAQWMGVGFIHGVMNTDNMSIAGETIDYGPCAFMDTYHPHRVFSSIDRGGRYAYSNQPRIAVWNLTRFATCLLPLIDDDQDRAAERASEAVNRFADLFTAAWTAILRAKLGLAEEEAADAELADGFLDAMAEGGADFTLAFRRLADDAGTGEGEPALRRAFADAAPLDRWLARWHERLARERRAASARRTAMRAASPAVIPRNHRVEQAIAAAREGDFDPFHALVERLAAPFDDADPADDPLAPPPAPDEAVHRTFCGT